MIAVALALLVVAAVGAVFTTLARPRASADLVTGTSFLAGSVAVALSMLALAGAGLSWSPVVIATVALVFGASGWALRMTRRGELFEIDRQGWSLRVADLLLVLVLVVHALYVTESAPHDWDYWAIWGLKAKVFFAAGGTIDWAFLRDPANSFAHPDYPPLLTLIYGWLGSWGEVWSDRWFGLAETTFIASLLLGVRGIVGSITRSARIGAWTALVLAFPAMQSRFAIADVPLFAFVTLGLLFLQRDLLEPGSRDALLGFFLLGGAALTKNEGLTWFGIAIVAHAGLTRQVRRTALLALPGIAVAAVWQIPRLVVGLATDVTGAGALGRLVDRILDPGWTATLVAAAPPELTAAAVAIVVAVVIARERLRCFTLLLVSTIAQCAVYLAIYATTPYDPAWHVATSWDRISLHLAIPVLVAAATALVERATQPPLPTSEPSPEAAS